MSQINSNTKRHYKHLDKTERNFIEAWLNEGKNQTEIAELLNRSKSTVSREIRRGTTTQLKQVNGYTQEVEVYYAETGQAVYNKNREKSHSKGLKTYSQKFWDTLKKAHNERMFTGKNRKYNIKTFVVVYQRKNPLEKVPTFKTIYNYIRSGEFFIKPIDLPVMVTLNLGGINIRDQREPIKEN